MNAVVTERLIDIARAAAAAGWGRATAIYDAAAEELGMSRQTLLRKLKGLRVAEPRKRRADAGKVALTRDEALLIAAVVEETRRKTGTGTVPLERAIELLRANGQIFAGRVDERTGEFVPLSTSAIRQAMRQYRVHPDQLAEPSPSTSLSSPHPNWCWEIDASISRQFYMGDDGARMMSAAEYYRGKPKNFERISDRRLWRYAITDHASGCIELHYVLGSESAGNLLDALIHTMSQRLAGTMHGVPHILYADPGSAVTSAAVLNLGRALGVRVLAHASGNSRATGQVETSHNIIERHFEAPLKLRAPATSLEEINAEAERWCRAFNATRVHTRTGVTRRDGWLRISTDQLVVAPRVDVLRSLAVSAPKPCTVRNGEIKFRGARYDVRAVRGLIQGQRVQVVRNPWDEASARILQVGDDGRETHVLVPRVELDGFGFPTFAAKIGTEFKAMPETEVDRNRKEIERLAMGAANDAEAEAKRKAKAVPFDGRIDPTKPTREANVTPHIPRRGREADVAAPSVQLPPVIEYRAPVIEAPRLTAVEAALRLRRIVTQSGGTWLPEFLGRVQARFGDAVPEDRLGEIAAWLTTTPANVRAIGGAA